MDVWLIGVDVRFIIEDCVMCMWGSLVRIVDVRLIGRGVDSWLDSSRNSSRIFVTRDLTRVTDL